MAKEYIYTTLHPILTHIKFDNLYIDSEGSVLRFDHAIPSNDNVTFRFVNILTEESNWYTKDLTKLHIIDKIITIDREYIPLKDKLEML